MTPQIAAAIELIKVALLAHVAHGHGNIHIQIRPESIRVEEGKGHIISLKKI